MIHKKPLNTTLLQSIAEKKYIAKRILTIAKLARNFHHSERTGKPLTEGEFVEFYQQGVHRTPWYYEHVGFKYQGLGVKAREAVENYFRQASLEEHIWMSDELDKQKIDEKLLREVTNDENLAVKIINQAGNIVYGLNRNRGKALTDKDFVEFYRWCRDQTTSPSENQGFFFLGRSDVQSRRAIEEYFRQQGMGAYIWRVEQQ